MHPCAPTGKGIYCKRTLTLQANPKGLPTRPVSQATLTPRGEVLKIMGTLLTPLTPNT